MRVLLHRSSQHILPAPLFGDRPTLSGTNILTQYAPKATNTSHSDDEPFSTQHSALSFQSQSNYLKMNRPLLTELSLDLQIHICEFLHPSQILALRQTSKTFREATSQRIVWIHALIRICQDNFLFLPTFPIHDMSDAELEHAATAPFQWIALSSSEARNDNGLLHCRTSRIIKNPILSMVKDLQYLADLEYVGFIDLYLVPGGRYLVTSGQHFLGVWDLGYVSDSNIGRDGKPTNMWAATVNYLRDFLVHPTPDGLGIRILAFSMVRDTLYVFEIYPQREAPQLTKIAELIFDLQEGDLVYSLNGNRVVIYERMKRVFMVWDFMANTVASWCITSQSLTDQIIKVTETVIIILHTDYGRPSLWIFQIPPLTTKIPLFDINEDLPEVAPVLTFKYPEAVLSWCQKPDGWYSCDLSSFPLYVDVFEGHQTGDLRRCKLDISRDLSTVLLVPTAKARLQHRQRYFSMVYRICDDRLVNVFDNGIAVEVDTIVGFGLSSDGHESNQIPTMNINMTPLAVTYKPFSFCPASARLVYTVEGDIVISDFL